MFETITHFLKTIFSLSYGRGFTFQTFKMTIHNTHQKQNEQMQILLATEKVG